MSTPSTPVDNPEKPENPLRSMGQFRRLFQFVRPYRGRLYLALVAISIGSLLGLAGPYTLQFLIDAVFKNNNVTLLNQITLLLIAIFLLQSVFYFFRSFLLSFIGERVMADLRIRLFSHLQTLSLSFYNERRTGELVSRLTNDVSTVRALVTSDISTALSQILTFIGALVLIVVTDWRLTLFMFALIPVVYVIAMLFGRRLRALSAQVQDQLASATTVLEEAIGGIRVVQSFVRENYEIQRFRENIEKTFSLAMSRTRISAMFGPLISFMGFAAVVSIFWFGGHEVLAGGLGPGGVLLFLAPPMTLSDAEAARGRMDIILAKRGYCFWAVERQADSAFLGFCGIKPGPDETPIAGELESAGGCDAMHGDTAMRARLRRPVSTGHGPTPPRRRSRQSRSSITTAAGD